VGTIGIRAQVERWRTPKRRRPELGGAAGRRKTEEMDGETDVGKDRLKQYKMAMLVL